MGSPREITDGEILEAIVQTGSQDKAARKLGIPRSTLGDRYRAIRGSATITEVPDYIERVAEVIHTNKKPPEELGYKDFLAGFKAAKDFRSKSSISYRHVKCRIDVATPIALTFISDVHLGSPYCDYDAFEHDISLIEGDSRFYVGKGGDWSDKMSNFRDKTAAVGQLHPEKIQLLAEEAVLEALSGRIVACVGGNHNRMDSRLTGLDSDFWIHRGKPFPYMPTGGLVELVIGDETYRILWTHQYGTGNSRLNPHNVFRWLRQELDSEADIFVLEHHHDPSMLTHEMQDFNKRQVVEIRTGSYKIEDKFSQQFFKAGRVGPQTVILFPDRKKIVPMHGAEALQDARVYLDGLKKAPKGR